MFRTALILLALCLAPPAQAGNNLNMPPAPASGSAQEPIRAEGSAGTDKTTAENASSQSASSRAGAAGNQQEPMGLSTEASAKAEAAATAGNQHALNPPFQYPVFSIADTPAAISCNIPGLAGRTILVPAGKNPMDFCPATAIAIHPQIANGPPPANWDSLDMEQDNIGKEELRALELRNKTPGQKTSGQQPP